MEMIADEKHTLENLSDHAWIAAPGRSADGPLN